jgi:hypothetical protein
MRADNHILRPDAFPEIMNDLRLLQGMVRHGVCHYEHRANNKQSEKYSLDEHVVSVSTNSGDLYEKN